MPALAPTWAAFAFPKCSFRNRLIKDDLPTFGAPIIIIVSSSECVLLNLSDSLINSTALVMIFRVSMQVSVLKLVKKVHSILNSSRSLLITLALYLPSKRSALFRTKMWGLSPVTYWLKSMYLPESGIRASCTSMTQSTLRNSDCICFKPFPMCPGNQRRGSLLLTLKTSRNLGATLPPRALILWNW